MLQKLRQRLQSSKAAFTRCDVWAWLGRCPGGNWWCPYGIPWDPVHLPVHTRSQGLTLGSGWDAERFTDGALLLARTRSPGLSLQALCLPGRGVLEELVSRGRWLPFLSELCKSSTVSGSLEDRRVHSRLPALLGGVASSGSWGLLSSVPACPFCPHSRLPRSKRRALEAQMRSEVLTLLSNLADLANAVHWLPPGVLWAGRFPPWLVGLMGTVSSLLSVYQAARAGGQTGAGDQTEAGSSP